MKELKEISKQREQWKLNQSLKQKQIEEAENKMK
jgi:hypothetical protein